MGFFNRAGSQTLPGPGGVNTGAEPGDEAVLFEDNPDLRSLGPGLESDGRIIIPTMPAQLENYGTEIDPQV